MISYSANHYLNEDHETRLEVESKYTSEYIQCYLCTNSDDLDYMRNMQNWMWQD